MVPRTPVDQCQLAQYTVVLATTVVRVIYWIASSTAVSNSPCKSASPSVAVQLLGAGHGGMDTMVGGDIGDRGWQSIQRGGGA